MRQFAPLREIGRTVRAVRTQRGLSQQQVAETAGVQRYQVANLELAKGNPSFTTLVSILGALDLEFSVGAVTQELQSRTHRAVQHIDLEEVLRRSRG
ncbi:MAG: helix-turn-helix protein [Actinomycetota bacterium]|jgi:HTH-type transcriptional regulator/antitoxin HipB